MKVRFILAAGIVLLIPFMHIAHSSRAWAENEAVSLSVSGLAMYSFTGYAAPNAVVTFLENGTAIGTTLTDQNGFFSKVIGEPDNQVHTISYYFTDKNGISSAILSSSYSTSINNLINASVVLFPPTIASSTHVLPQNQSLVESGYTVPNGQVALTVDGNPFQTEASARSDGFWSITIPGSDLGLGLHAVSANVTYAATTSSQSSTEAVYVTKPVIPSVSQSTQSGGALSQIPVLRLPLQTGWLPEDFNHDHIVNETDLGMLLAHFEQPVTGSSPYDLNHDQSVDVTDFSIFLYYWDWRD